MFNTLFQVIVTDLTKQQKMFSDTLTKNLGQQTKPKQMVEETL